MDADNRRGSIDISYSAKRRIFKSNSRDDEDVGLPWNKKIQPRMERPFDVDGSRINIHSKVPRKTDPSNSW